MTDLAILHDYELRLSQRPENYFGLINEWMDEGFSGAIFSIHRDSNILDQSNWAVVNEVLERWIIRSDDGAVRVAGSNHWAVGWVDTIHIKIRNHRGKFTKPFRVAVGLLERMQDYPLLDEEDYSRREWEDFQEYCEQEVGDKAEELASWLYDNYSVCNSEDIRYTWVEEWKNLNTQVQ